LTAPVSSIERPTGAAKKGCACEKGYEILRRRLEQLEADLTAHQLEEEEAKRPVMWVYKCMICGKLVEALGGIQPGQTLRCPVHGVVPLDLVSPRPS
jgi:hypothetical protein